MTQLRFGAVVAAALAVASNTIGCSSEDQPTAFDASQTSDSTSAEASTDTATEADTAPAFADADTAADDTSSAETAPPPPDIGFETIVECCPRTMVPGCECGQTGGARRNDGSCPSGACDVPPSDWIDSIDDAGCPYWKILPGPGCHP